MSATHHNEKDMHQPNSLPQGELDASLISSVSLDKDIAIGLVGEHARDYDPEVEAKVLRTIDWYLIPMMIVGM
jgi:hypothetical protein